MFVEELVRSLVANCGIASRNLIETLGIVIARDINNKNRKRGNLGAVDPSHDMATHGRQGAVREAHAI